MNCNCLELVTEATAVGYITGGDGIVWIYGEHCQVHHEPAVSPIWHPTIGWLSPEQNEADTVDAVPALMEV